MIHESKLKAIKDFQWPNGHWAGTVNIFNEYTDNRNIKDFTKELYCGTIDEDDESLWEAQLILESNKATLTHNGVHLLQLLYEARGVKYKKQTPTEEYLNL